jgi:hypothetical protein
MQTRHENTSFQDSTWLELPCGQQASPPVALGKYSLIFSKNMTWMEIGFLHTGLYIENKYLRNRSVCFEGSAETLCCQKCSAAEKNLRTIVLEASERRMNFHLSKSLHTFSRPYHNHNHQYWPQGPLRFRYQINVLNHPMFLRLSTASLELLLKQVLSLHSYLKGKSKLMRSCCPCVYTGCFKDAGAFFRSEFSSPKVTKKFMYTLVAKRPVSEIRSLEFWVENSNKGRLTLYMTAVHITVDKWFPNGVSQHPGVSGGTTRCVAKFKKNI